MRPVDYDHRLHRTYAAGRALTDAQRTAWSRAFATRLPAARPLRALDLGSGTGRFTPLLAAEFGGPVTGAEPSARMREQAVAHAAHPRAAYVPGRAEALPLPDESADFALCFLVWHHVRDKPAGARELHRVVRPGGTLLLRTELTDSHERVDQGGLADAAVADEGGHARSVSRSSTRAAPSPVASSSRLQATARTPSGAYDSSSSLPDLWYLDAFPRGRDVLAALYQPLSVLRATFETAGWEVKRVGEVGLPAPGTWAGALARLRTRAFSIFEHMPEADIEAGFAEWERRVAAAPQAPAPVTPGTVVTFRRG
ncbi:class I SAM-dependent methyltransferase [Streptomyces sp. B22F1]|uniref:class I SAM-dependent methyltransferase n=1 Tax=Streptomyces sp. B22F1 TaxID=3153566 RepID=UPI00325C8DE8